MAKFTKGQSGNLQGRSKGVPNKITTDVRVSIKNVVEGRLTELNDDLDSMGKFQKWQVIEKLMRFAFPTLTAVKMEADIKQDSNIQISINYIKKDESEGN